MQAKLSLSKQIVRSVQILDYLKDLQAYEINVLYEQEGQFSNSTLFIPQAFLYPFAIQKTNSQPETQATEADIPRQELTTLATSKMPDVEHHEQSVQCEENKVKPSEQKKQFDYDSFVSLESASQQLYNLKRQILTVRTKLTRKRLKL